MRTKLAYVLLAFQVIIPWTVPHFVTQDGPSHLYTALVTRSILTDSSSIYSSAYQLNERLVPNWGGTVAFNLAMLLAGIDHAEKLLMSAALLLGFFSITYALKALAPTQNPITPLTNFLIQTWFLWLGFYSFYLGMVALPWLLGYYWKHRPTLTRKNTAILAAGFVALFFTHLIPTALATLTLVTIALWMRDWRVLPAILPASLLALNFARTSTEPLTLEPAILQAFESFPKNVFITAAGRAGNQTYLWYAVFALIAIAIFTLSRKEWRSVTGGLAIATLLTFLAYFVVPEAGMGGMEAKGRIAWGVFLLGGLLVATARRLHLLQSALAIYCFVLVLGNLIPTMTTLWRTSRAVEDYLAATAQIPPGSKFVRLLFPMPAHVGTYDYANIGRDPLFHLDAYIAARCRCLDLSDYQAPNKIFPVVLKPSFTEDQQTDLWALESAANEGGRRLALLRQAIPLDYAIVVAERTEELSQLGPTTSQSAFVRLYRLSRPE